MNEPLSNITEISSISEQIRKVDEKISQFETQGIIDYPDYRTMSLVSIVEEKERLEKLVEKRESQTPSIDYTGIAKHLTMLEYNKIRLDVINKAITMRFPCESPKTTTPIKRSREDDDESLGKRPRPETIE
jgi:hypothetical protein